ncbi:MAG TPA: MlaD family protein [Bacteriovoracaceae bacterium]|nr:MlaD family protein [Bacteriovoracaceae bacterium]
MLFRKRDQKQLIKAGAFLSFLTIVLMIMIVSISKENSFFESKTILKARVSNVNNLQPGSYVELRGIKIGSVQNIEIVSDEDVEITMKVLNSQIKWIKKDAKISIATAGLVGDKFLEILPGSKEAPSIDPSKDVLSTEKKEIFNELVDKGGSIASSTEKVLMHLEALVGSQKFEEFLLSLHKTSQNLEKITTELTKADLSNSIKSLNKTTKRVDKILNRVEEGPGSLHSFIYDDSVHEDLRALLGGAQRNKMIKYFIRQSIKNSESKD